MAIDSSAFNPDFRALRFAAMLKAAHDFGLDQGVVNAIAIAVDPRRPDLAQVADALTQALLARDLLVVPDAA